MAPSLAYALAARPWKVAGHTDAQQKVLFSQVSAEQWMECERMWNSEGGKVHRLLAQSMDGQLSSLSETTEKTCVFSVE